MVKVVAKRPLDEDALKELALLSDPGDVDFKDTSTKGFTAEADEATILVKGEQIRYVPFTDIPRAGTITDIKVYMADELAFVISDAALNIRSLSRESDPNEAMRKILSGKDTFTGSEGDDVFSAGANSDKLNGKGGEDRLYGENGNDVLDGGTGSDWLDAGSGKDTYMFKKPPGSGVDTIVEFQAGEQMKIAKSAFEGLTKGQLSADQFVSGTDAADGNDRIIYDPSTGAVYHDLDGSGGVAKTQFATILEDSGGFGAGNIFVI